MTVHSRVIKTFLAWSPGATDVPLMNGLRIQILPTISALPRARKHQFAAFVASDGLLIVWDDDPSHLMGRAETIESELMELVWKAGAPQEAGEANHEKGATRATEFEFDKESGEIFPEQRPTNLMNSILVAFTLVIILTLLGLSFRSVAVEAAVDKGYTRLAFLALTPVQVFFTLVRSAALFPRTNVLIAYQFFSQVLVGCIAQCIGPIRQMQENSKYFSAKCSPRLQNRALPHITVQCPVYKEGLTSVIAPTVKSIKQAISTYELQGGSANMLVNDDGLQIIGDEERRARIDFYADHSIGWTARPKHGSEGFLRRGKFKKVCNPSKFILDYTVLSSLLMLI
jgi:heme/copper-type cytochrome/quinol oxidase subunit 4